MRADVVVVGAGLAGSALAARLARGGRRVLLLEKDDLPRHKLCGEFLSPESQRELEQIGALDRLLALEPARIRRARFSTAGGGRLALRLPGEGLGLSRYALDQGLFEVARDAGAEARLRAPALEVAPAGSTGFAVRFGDPETPEEAWAPYVVLAHGRRARLDRALDRPFMAARHPYLGLKRHHRPTDDAAGRALAAELDDHVEIHAFDGGYCGMSYVETGAVNVCMLLEQRTMAASEGGDWERVRARLLSTNPRLRARLEALEPAEARVWAVAQVPFVDKARHERGLLFVGDAAGMIAPLAGDGQAMALSSARILGDLLLSAPRRPRPEDRAALGRRWDLAWRRHFTVRMRLALALQGRLLEPRRAERTVRGVAALPGLASALARLTRGRAPLRSGRALG